MTDYSVPAALAALGIDAKRDGREWVARCPAHQDKHPSWRIYDRPGDPKHGLHHCWPCSFGGTLVDLVIRVMGYGTRDGAEGWLQRNAAPRAPPTPVAVRLEHPPLERRTFALPPGVVVGEPVAQWPAPVRRYARARGLTRSQVDRWGIGYAVDGPLAGRLVVPVHDDRGALCSYMARDFTGGAKRRYLYPRIADGMDRGALFGERYWPPAAVRRRALVVVTEGALKSLAVERAVPGTLHAALGGSRAEAMHLAKLATFLGVVVLTDADAAGHAAAAEIAAGLARHVPVARAALPPGQDADSVPLEQLRSVLCRSLGVRSSEG